MCSLLTILYQSRNAVEACKGSLYSVTHYWVGICDVLLTVQPWTEMFNDSRKTGLRLQVLTLTKSCDKRLQKSCVANKSSESS